MAVIANVPDLAIAINPAVFIAGQTSATSHGISIRIPSTDKALISCQTTFTPSAIVPDSDLRMFIATALDRAYSTPSKRYRGFPTSLEVKFAIPKIAALKMLSTFNLAASIETSSWVLPGLAVFAACAAVDAATTIAGWLHATADVNASVMTEALCTSYRERITLALSAVAQIATESKVSWGFAAVMFATASTVAQVEVALGFAVGLSVNGLANVLVTYEDVLIVDVKELLGSKSSAINPTKLEIEQFACSLAAKELTEGDKTIGDSSYTQQVLDGIASMYTQVAIDTDVSGDFVSRNVSAGLFSPIISAVAMQAIEPEDAAYLVPILTIEPVTSLGAPIVKSPAIQMKGNGIRFESTSQDALNFLGSDEPQLFVERFELTYANEVGPYKTFRTSLTGKIVNPAKCSDPNNSIGQLLRHGSYFAIQFGYDEQIVDRIIGKVRKTFPTISYKQLANSLVRRAVVQISSPEIDGSQPSTWDIKVDMIGVWDTALLNGVFLGPYNAKTIATARAMYRNYSEAILKVHTQLDELSAAKAKAKIASLRDEYMATRLSLRKHIVSSTKAMFAALKTSPESVSTAAQKNLATSATPKSTTSIVRKAAGKTFVSLPAIVHLLLMPSFVQLVQDVGSGIPDTVASTTDKRTTTKLSIAFDDDISQTIIDEVEAVAETSTALGTLLSKIACPKKYSDVFVNVDVLEQWLATVLQGGAIPSIKRCLQLFNSLILGDNRTYYEYAFAKENIAVNPELLRQLPAPRPSLVIHRKDRNKFDNDWVVRMTDYEDVVNQLNAYARLYEQASKVGASAKFKQLFFATFDSSKTLQFGNRNSITGELRFATKTATEVANMNVGLAAQNLYSHSDATSDKLAKMVQGDVNNSPSRAFDAAQFLGPLLPSIALCVVSFETNVGLIDAEPQKPIRVMVGPSFGEFFIITDVQLVIEPHRIRTNLGAASLLRDIELAKLRAQK